ARPVRVPSTFARRAGQAWPSRTPNPTVNESPRATIRKTPGGFGPGSGPPRKPAALVRTGTRNSGRARMLVSPGAPARGVKRGSPSRPSARSARTRTTSPGPTARLRVASAAGPRRIGSGVPPWSRRVVVDLRRGAGRAERTRGPPAPLDAVDARGRREIAAHVLLTERAHSLAVPRGEDAVLHVAERRLHVVVALARDQRAVPEDVAVVPEVRARTADGRFFVFDRVLADRGHLVSPGIEVLHVHLVDLGTRPAAHELRHLLARLVHGDDLEDDPKPRSGLALQVEQPLDVVHHLVVVRADADALVGRLGDAVHGQVQLAHPRGEDFADALLGEECDVRRRLHPEVAGARAADHLEQLGVHHRLAPGMEDERGPHRGDLLDDPFEEPHVHVALRARDHAEP